MTFAVTENGKKVLTMAEYIEREVAIRFLLNDSPEQVNYSREDAADCIRYMNAADVAEVVRCEDCEHFRTNDENVPYCLNPFGLDDPEPNGFCNYGIGKN